MTRNKKTGRPVRDAVKAAIHKPRTEPRHMQQQQNMAPLDLARLGIEQATQERNKFFAIIVVLLGKLGDNAVITHAELEGIDPNVKLQQKDTTQIGFRLVLEKPPTN